MQHVFPLVGTFLSLWRFDNTGSIAKLVRSIGLPTDFLDCGKTLLSHHWIDFLIHTNQPRGKQKNCHWIKRVNCFSKIWKNFIFPFQHQIAVVFFLISDAPRVIDEDSYFSLLHLSFLTAYRGSEIELYILEYSEWDSWDILNISAKFHAAFVLYLH